MRAARSPFGPALPPAGSRGFYCLFFFHFLKIMEPRQREKTRQGSGEGSLRIEADIGVGEMGELGLYSVCNSRIWLGLKERTEESAGKFRRECQRFACVRDQLSMNMQQVHVDRKHSR